MSERARHRVPGSDMRVIVKSASELWARPDGVPRPSVVQRFSRAVYFTVMGLTVVVIAFIGVAGVIDSSEPTYWGTYTEEYCKPRLRGGCHSFGTWVSDDGAIRLEEARLDGSANPDGTVRAEYGPTGIHNDAQSNIVHAARWASASLWVPWLCLAAIAGVTVQQAYRWRRGEVGLTD